MLFKLSDVESADHLLLFLTCSNFKRRSSFRESGQFYILKKLHCSSSPEMLNYASRNRLKTITMNIHLTAFCKLTTYFVFIFHGPFVLAFTCTSVLEIRGKLLRAGVLHCRHGQIGAGWPDSSLPHICSAVSFCSRYLCKGGNRKSFSVFPSSSKTYSRPKMAGTKW